MNTKVPTLMDLLLNPPKPDGDAVPAIFRELEKLSEAQPQQESSEGLLFEAVRSQIKPR